MDSYVKYGKLHGLVHPCAKVMALFFKCENFQTLTFTYFLKIWAFQIEVW